MEDEELDVYTVYDEWSTFVIGIEGYIQAHYQRDCQEDT